MVAVVFDAVHQHHNGREIDVAGCYSNFADGNMFDENHRALELEANAKPRDSTT